MFVFIVVEAVDNCAVDVDSTNGKIAVEGVVACAIVVNSGV